MKNSNTFAVSFHIKKSKANDGKAPIYLRITVNGERTELAIKRSVEVSLWHESRGIVKGKRPEHKVLNTFLEQIRFRITEIYQELWVQKSEISAQIIKSKFVGEDEFEDEKTLVELMNYHNLALKDTIEPGTLKNYYTTQRYVEKFIKKKLKRKDLPLSQLRYSFLLEFTIFLKNSKYHMSHRPCGQNTIMKHIERLRKMINLAVRNDWISKDPFAKFKPKFVRKDREFLSQKELKAIEQKQFGIERLVYVKDLFLFGCYTGLAYSDVMQLNKTHIHEDDEGNLWIHTKRKKTDNPIKIPLLDPAVKLLKKYENFDLELDNGALFPNISNQRLNSYLGEIADVCGIKKKLTFHLARHTFATTITLTNGVPIETVSKLLGHTSIKTTQIYAKVIEKKLGEDMAKLNDFLSSKKY